MLWKNDPSIPHIWASVQEPLGNAVHTIFAENVTGELARFKGAESAMLIQSGFNANQAVIPPIVGKEDLVFSDELNHASIIDGCRLSGAKVIRWNHL